MKLDHEKLALANLWLQMKLTDFGNHAIGKDETLNREIPNT